MKHVLFLFVFFHEGFLKAAVYRFWIQTLFDGRISRRTCLMAL